MENWEEGWDRLLEEANRQLQKETKRIQDAWKGIYAGSRQPDFTSRVYGEEPVRRAESARTDAGSSNSRAGAKKYYEEAFDRSGADRKEFDKKLPEQLVQLLQKIRRDAPSPFVDYRVQRNPLYQLNFFDESVHFYQQAVFMADYEDNCPYEGEIGQIFWPTYQKLNTAQLRGYFTWRTKVRRVYEAYRAAVQASSLNKPSGYSVAQETVSEEDAEQETATRETTGQEQPTHETAELQREKSSAKSENREVPKSRVIAEAPLCYQYLYVYEILNQVGVDSVWDGYQRLKYMEANLEGQKSGILPHLRDWLFDYVIYYQLDRNLLSDTKRVTNDHALSVLLAVEERTPEEVFDAASVLSIYQVGNSRYVREHLEQYQEILYRVLVQMVSYYEKNRKAGFWESLFGAPVVHAHQMFEGAMFYDRHINLRDCRQEIHYELDELCSFDYSRGRWNCDGYYRVEKNATLGQIMCAVDAELRTQYQYEYPIRNTLELKYLKEIVVREVHRQYKEEEKRKKQEELAAKYAEKWRKEEELRQKRLEELRLREEEEKRRQEEERKKREVVLDFGKLDEIRRAAELTQQRLLVEEQAETETTEIIENIEKDQVSNKNISEEKTESIENADADKYKKISVNGVTLSDAEVYILRALLDGQDYKAYFQSHHLMPSLIAESLNEKLLDEIGDIVIEFDGDEAALVEDYVDEIKAILS